MFRYRLRTLLILMAALPPIIGGLVLSVFWLASLPQKQMELIYQQWVFTVLVVGLAAYFAVEYAVKLSERS